MRWDGIFFFYFGWEAEGLGSSGRAQGRRGEEEQKKKEI
jgi:hypothetical protein